MKQGSAMPMLAITILIGLVGTAVADTQPTVKVGVYAQHLGGKIVYHYRATNNTQQDITAITIGRDTQNDVNPDNDVYELVERPSGWNLKFDIPQASCNAPSGWRASLVTPEEGSKTHAIKWEIINDKSPMLLSGQTLSKLSITLDNADANYISAHALATFTDGIPVNLTVPIERLDRSPPEFTVVLNPNTILPQSGKLVPVNASFTVKDNYDSLPEIRLESITASEPVAIDDIQDASIGLDDRYFKFRAESKNPAGRVYTVTYSATDASGNQTLATGTVTVTAATTVPAIIPNFAP